MNSGNPQLVIIWTLNSSVPLKKKNILLQNDKRNYFTLLRITLSTVNLFFFLSLSLSLSLNYNRSSSPFQLLAVTYKYGLANYAVCLSNGTQRKRMIIVSYNDIKDYVMVSLDFSSIYGVTIQ